MSAKREKATLETLFNVLHKYISVVKLINLGKFDFRHVNNKLFKFLRFLNESNSNPGGSFNVHAHFFFHFQ